MKGLFFILLAIIGVIFAIIRAFRNNSATNSIPKLIEKLESDPNFANELKDQLFMTIDYRNFPNGLDFSALMRSLALEMTLGDFVINYKKQFNSSTWLVVTTCNHSSYDLNMRGRMDDVKKVYNMNFIIQFDEEKNRLNVNSDFTKELAQKSIRQNFSGKLFDLALMISPKAVDQTV